MLSNDNKASILLERGETSTLSGKEADELKSLLLKSLNSEREEIGSWLVSGDRNRLASLEKRHLLTLLESEGYYAAEINYTLRDVGIVYSVIPGSRYSIVRINLINPFSQKVPDSKVLLKTGDFLSASSVLATKKQIETYVAKHFCIYEVNVDYKVTVAHVTRSASVEYILTPSPVVNFGDVEIIGLESVDLKYIADRVAIEKGECFRQAEVKKAQLALIKTGLFSSVIVSTGQALDGSVPLTLTVKERSHRTMSAGLGFSNDEGFGVSGAWEHRNFFGEAEHLAIDVEFAEKAQRGSASITLPNYVFDEQSLSLYLEQENLQTTAFQSTTGKSGARILRVLDGGFSLALGAELAFSSVEEGEDKDSFSLISAPVGLEYDRRNDLLNPSSGWFMSAQFRPYWSTADLSEDFLRSIIEGSAYFTLSKLAFRPTFAVNAAAGSISDTDRESVPADIRFYAGGGGSVRGYPYQSLGPLDEDGDPAGGLSFSSVAFETRLRFGERWGMVIFLDGGTAYEQVEPTFDESYAWGVGLGARFYSSFAPFRIDFAVPLNKREGFDDDFQVYASIGQSF